MTREEKIIAKVKKLKEKNKTKYISKKHMKKKFKNSQTITNIKEVGDDGLIYLKSGEVCSLIEVDAIDLSLTSKQEKQNFFTGLKALYKIKGLNLKCYKLDDKINLNKNKVNLERLINLFKDDDTRKNLLEENKKLIEYLEDNNYTISSVYYWVVIAKTVEELEKVLDEIEEIINDIVPKIKIEFIHNKLQIYRFISNLYLSSSSLEQLLWSELPELACPLNVSERTNNIKFDDTEFQLVTIKNIPPFVEELFFERIFNVPNVRACLSIKDTITQDELIRWVNSQYQFLLSDRNTTKKLSDATELDRQEENCQALMQEIKMEMKR